MHVLIETGMRDRLCMIVKRHAKANNPQLGYLDPEQPLSYIAELEPNNPLLVGNVRIPTNGRRILGLKVGIGDFNWQQMVDEAHIGYITLCELVYPLEFNDAHNDYPLGPDIQV